MKTIAIAALAASAGLALANPVVGVNGYTSSTDLDTWTAGPADVTVFDVTGVESWDGNGDSDNMVFNLNIGAGSHVIGLGWDVTIETVGGSYLSEAMVAFENTAQDAGVFLTPSGDTAPGTGSYSSGGVFDLVGAGLDFVVDADGMLRLEFFEGYDDVSDAIDAMWLSGALTIEYTPIPAPASVALLGLGGLVATRRRR